MRCQSNNTEANNHPAGSIDVTLPWEIRATITTDSGGGVILNQPNVVVLSDAGAINYYGFEINTGGPVYATNQAQLQTWKGATSSAASTIAWTKNTPHVVRAVFDGTNISLYVDGTLIRTDAVTPVAAAYDLYLEMRNNADPDSTSLNTISLYGSP